MLPNGPAFPAMQVLWCEQTGDTRVASRNPGKPESVEPDMCLHISCAEIVRVHPASNIAARCIGVRILVLLPTTGKKNGTLTEEERWEEIGLHA